MNRPIPRATGAHRQKGAALLIMLVVLILASSYILIKRLGDSRSFTEQNNLTLATLGDVREALLGFYVVNSRLPCPATAGSGEVEDPTPFGAGPCTTTHGFVPARTLGLPGTINGDSLLTDVWGNPIRYSLNPASLRVCRTASCSSPLTGISAVLYSMGADGAIQPTSTDQISNGEVRISAATVGPLGIRYWVSSNPDFVSHEHSSQFGNEFDDLVRWVFPADLPAP